MESGYNFPTEEYRCQKILQDYYIKVNYIKIFAID